MNRYISNIVEPLLEFASNSLGRIFFIVAFLNFLSTILYNHLVWNEVIYLNDIGMKAPDSFFMKASKGRSYINYFIDLFSPIWLYIKLGIASLLMYSIAYFFKINISIKDLLKNNLVAYLFVIFGDVIYSTSIAS